MGPVGVGDFPDESRLAHAWLADEPAFASVAEHRNAYGRYLLNRLRQPHAFVEEAVRARSLHL